MELQKTDRIQIGETSQKQVSTRKVPTLSLFSYTEGSVQEQKKFIDDLFLGIKDYGFIILKDHHLGADLLKRAYELSAQFFALSEKSKLQYSGIQGGQRGYTPFGQEHAKDAHVMDLKEFWHVGRELPPQHPFSIYCPENVWPSEIPEFRKVFLEVYNSLEQSGQALLQALTFSLDEDIHYFEKMTDLGNSILRLLHYPPIADGVDPRCLRAAPHEDINLITLLPAATASGLQLKDRDGQWLDVQSDWGDLIVDAGDMLSRITNNLIPSTTHQVVNVEGHQSRYSMPFFMHPNPEAILACLKSCELLCERPADISAHDFLMQRLAEIGLLKKV